jgi:molybdopterin synthase catalytic subunit
MSVVNVTVRLFASYREAAGFGSATEALPSGSRVRDLSAQLLARVPNLGAGKGLVAVNHEYVGEEMLLHDGDEVAYIPPVSGGA